MLTRHTKLAFKRLSAALISFGTMAVSAPAAAEDDDRWGGFYVGVNAGGAWSNSDAKASLSTNSSAPVPAHPIAGGDVTSINQANVKAHFDSKNHSTFTGGIEAGYNYVMKNGILVGIETDLGIFDIKGSRARSVQSPLLINPPITYTVRQSVNTDFLWTLRPRVGYEMGDFLIFASGGLAMTKTHYNARFVDSSSSANLLTDSASKTRTGWTLGGGAAWAFTPRFSVKGEYLYQDFGTSKASATSTNGYLTLVNEAHLRSHLFRAGVDYRF
jgi:outer membrane immunogenic protein